MGASNFHTANASQTYVIDFGDDECVWLESQEYLGSWIEELIKEDKSKTDFCINDDIKSQEELRSYSTSSIGKFTFDDEFIGVDIRVTVNLFMRSGYYEAANLDWEIEVLFDDSEYEDFEDFDEDCLILDHDIAQSTWNLHSSRFHNRVEALVDEAISTTEGYMTKISKSYNVDAKLSNGETIYSEA